MAWESKLKDRRAKAVIAARIFRLANGLPGDVSPVGQGVSELRGFTMAQAIGVYPQQRGTEIVILLCGGDKEQPGQGFSPRRNAWQMSGGRNDRANL
ncbi:type II toxin-antitoxin system RelE/ParE family toxin [Pseudomonas aeruginosa]|nr:type II toxin-antitoxin system RelE/ParE family toxin [Pseudomonas aeruginosa]